MKATRIPQLVLLCAVSLTVASTIGITLLSTTAPSMDTATSIDLLDFPKLTRSMIQKLKPMGDPIDDPKPNNVKH